MSMKKNFKRYLRRKVGPAQLGLASRMVPRAVIEKAQLDALRKQVKYCANKSAYYKARFNELGINPEKITSIQDLKDLITPNSAVVEQPENFLCCPPQIAFETTGTKGRNKRIYFTNGEVGRATSHITLAFTMYGFTPQDRFCNFFNFSFWIPGILNQKAAEKFEAFCLPAGKVDPEEIYERLEFYKINVLMGYPSLLMRLTELADKNGRFPMKGIMCSGEHLPEHLRSYIQDVWSCKVYRGYGCTESCGGIGGECVHQSGYHIDEVDRIVEIENPDKDGYGEIVLTTLYRECMPLLRYKVADVGRLETSRCKCGLPTYRISDILGRSDDKITIGSVDMHPVKLFDDILSRVPDVTEDYKVRAFWDDRIEVIELTAEAAPSHREHSAAAIFNEIKESYPDFWKNYSLKMLDFRINYAEPRSLRGNNVKLNKFTDSRREQERQR